MVFLFFFGRALRVPFLSCKPTWRCWSYAQSSEVESHSCVPRCVVQSLENNYSNNSSDDVQLTRHEVELLTPELISSDRTDASLSTFWPSCVALYQRLTKHGNVSFEELEHVVNQIGEKDVISFKTGHFMLSCCSVRCLQSVSVDENIKLAQRILFILLQKGMCTTSHCNTLLQTLLESKASFSPLEVLSTMLSNGIKPDQLTYCRLLLFYLQNGDYSSVSALLNVWKADGMSVSAPHLFPLISAFAKHGQLGVVDELLKMVVGAADVAVDHLTCAEIIKTCAMNSESDTSDNGTCLNNVLCIASSALNLHNLPPLAVQSYLEAVVVLAENKYDNHILKVLKLLPFNNLDHKPFEDAAKRLVNNGQFDAAFLLLRHILNAESINASTDTVLKMFFLKLVEQSPENLMQFPTYCKALSEYGIPNPFARWAVKEFSNASFVFVIAFSILKGAELKVHHFWPLLRHYAASNSFESFNSIVQWMKRSNVELDSETQHILSTCSLGTSHLNNALGTEIPQIKQQAPYPPSPACPEREVPVEYNQTLNDEFEFWLAKVKLDLENQAAVDITKKAVSKLVLIWNRAKPNVDSKTVVKYAMQMCSVYVAFRDVDAALVHYHEAVAASLCNRDNEEAADGFDLKDLCELAGLLVECRRSDEAIELFRTHSRKTVPATLGSSHQPCVQQLLQKVDTFDGSLLMRNILDSILENKHCVPKLQYIKQLIYASLHRRDLHGSIDAFVYFGQKGYAVSTPILQQILKNVILANDGALLEKAMNNAMDQFSQEQALVTLAMGYVANGKISEARATLSDSRIEKCQAVLDKWCQHFLKKRKIDELRNLVLATKTLPFRRDILYEYLMLALHAKSDWRGACDVWTDMQASKVNVTVQTKETFKMLLIENNQNHDVLNTVSPLVPETLMKKPQQQPEPLVTQSTSSLAANSVSHHCKQGSHIQQPLAAATTSERCVSTTLNQSIYSQAAPKVASADAASGATEYRLQMLNCSLSIDRNDLRAALECYREAVALASPASTADLSTAYDLATALLKTKQFASSSDLEWTRNLLSGLLLGSRSYLQALEAIAAPSAPQVSVLKSSTNPQKALMNPLKASFNPAKVAVNHQLPSTNPLKVFLYAPKATVVPHISSVHPQAHVTLMHPLNAPLNPQRVAAVNPHEAPVHPQIASIYPHSINAHRAISHPHVAPMHPPSSSAQMPSITLQLAVAPSMQHPTSSAASTQQFVHQNSGINTASTEVTKPQEKPLEDALNCAMEGQNCQTGSSLSVSNVGVMSRQLFSDAVKFLVGQSRPDDAIRLIAQRIAHDSISSDLIERVSRHFFNGKDLNSLTKLHTTLNETADKLQVLRYIWMLQLERGNHESILAGLGQFSCSDCMNFPAALSVLTSMSKTDDCFELIHRFTSKFRNDEKQRQFAAAVWFEQFVNLMATAKYNRAMVLYDKYPLLHNLLCEQASDLIEAARSTDNDECLLKAARLLARNSESFAQAGQLYSALISRKLDKGDLAAANVIYKAAVNDKLNNSHLDAKIISRLPVRHL